MKDGYKTIDLTHQIYTIAIFVLIAILIITNLAILIAPNQVNAENSEKTKQNIETIKMLQEEIEKDLEIINQELEYYGDYLEYIDRAGVSFNPDNLREKSDIKLDQIEDILSGTAFESYAYIFIEAEQTYDVNALFLVALAAHESGWGKSRLATEKNNLTGFTAYNYDPYNCGTTFRSPEDSIMTTASKISENYLTEGGKYYNGYSVEGVNTRYAVLDDGSINLEWSQGITHIASDLKAEAVVKEEARYLASLESRNNLLLVYAGDTL